MSFIFATGDGYGCEATWYPDQDFWVDCIPEVYLNLLTMERPGCQRIKLFTRRQNYYSRNY
ncbi:MAG: hypothetical protein IPI65_01530 [Bacteroidetes bacterium]|nr:hypothetical protein [Bacteroidota bacterium]